MEMEPSDSNVPCCSADGPGNCRPTPGLRWTALLGPLSLGVACAACCAGALGATLLSIAGLGGLLATLWHKHAWLGAFGLALAVASALAVLLAWLGRRKR